MLGLMIGIYTWIRLLSLVTRSGERKEHLSVRIFAILGLIVIPLLIFELVLGSRTALGTLP